MFWLLTSSNNNTSSIPKRKFIVAGTQNPRNRCKWFNGDVYLISLRDQLEYSNKNDSQQHFNTYWIRSAMDFRLIEQIQETAANKRNIVQHVDSSPDPKLVDSDSDSAEKVYQSTSSSMSEDDATNDVVWRIDGWIIIIHHHHILLSSDVSAGDPDWPQKDVWHSVAYCEKVLPK